MATWTEIETELGAQPWGTEKTVPRGEVPHPREAGYRQDRGWPKGQDADWRRKRDDGSGYHVREYPDRWEVHIDDVDPDSSLVGHFRADLPVLFMLTGAALGAGVGYAAAKRRGAAWGAGAGWLLSAVVAAQGGRKP